MKRLETAQGSFLCWNLDDVTRALEYGTWWDAQLRPAIDATRTDGWAIDLGAHIGWFTVYLAGRFEHVLAVEAHPKTVGLLRMNVANHMLSDKVSIVSGAAYSYHATLGLATSLVHGWPEGEEPSFADPDKMLHVATSTFVEEVSQQHAAREWLVETVVVDEIVPEGVTVRLIKVDVQGAALRALYGCQRIITKDRPRILLEFEQWASEVRQDYWEDYLAFFDKVGYVVERIEGPWEDYLAVPCEAGS